MVIAMYALRGCGVWASFLGVCCVISFFGVVVDSGWNLGILSLLLCVDSGSDVGREQGAIEYPTFNVYL